MVKTGVLHDAHPNGKTLNVKAGTQHIDHAWRFLKDRIHVNQSERAGSKALRARIRSTQYKYWMNVQGRTLLSLNVFPKTLRLQRVFASQLPNLWPTHRGSLGDAPWLETANQLSEWHQSPE